MTKFPDIDYVVAGVLAELLHIDSLSLRPWSILRKNRTVGGLDCDALELGQRVMSILERGQKTATYKLATLTALIQYCVENPSAVDVPIDDPADRVINIYWPQVHTSTADTHCANPRSPQKSLMP